MLVLVEDAAEAVMPADIKRNGANRCRGPAEAVRAAAGHWRCPGGDGALVPDQGAVEQLPPSPHTARVRAVPQRPSPAGQDPAFHERVHSRHLDTGETTLMPTSLNTVSNRAGYSRG
jgi:hypothetical protein